MDEILRRSKNQIPIVETRFRQKRFSLMTSQGPIERAERELAEVKGLVDEQYGIVIRLKRIGADTKKAIRLLIDLLELQQIREQRLAHARNQHRRSVQ